jgi:hypothetical protein
MYLPFNSLILSSINPLHVRKEKKGCEKAESIGKRG